MSVITVDGVEYVPRGRLRTRASRVLGRAVASASAAREVLSDRVLPALRNRTRPVAGHISDHAYTILGLGCWDAGWFTHSAFSGLLWTAVTFIMFEWKVGE